MDKDDLVNSNLDKLNNAIELLRQKIDADQQLIGRLQSKLPVASATRTQDINAEINELNVHISACQSMITQLQDAENQFLSATNSGSTN
jgi:prefoldin subunit 5